MDATVHHRDGLAFEVEIDDHRFTIDSNAEGAGQGPTPKQLLLASLAGCTAMDVTSILRKMRQTVTSFRVRAEGTPTEGPHPHTLVDFVVVYEVEGDVKPDRLLRAVELSKGTYCGVSKMLEKHSPIRARVILNGEELIPGS